MNTLRVPSHARRQRSVMLLPAMDRWIEREAARLGVSFSEAMNRLLASYWQFHQEANTDCGPNNHGVAQLTPALLAHLKEPLLAQMQAVREEVEKLKSNLHLLQILQDRAVAKTLTPRQYDEWREEARSMLAKRQGGKG